MCENYIEFEGKNYVINISKLIDIVSKTNDTLKDKSKVETWGYVADADTNETDFRVIQREISETSSDGSETFSSIKYDLLKNLLNLILSPIAYENGNVLFIHSFEDMLFGQMLAFNTLVNEGIIIEVND